jgi:hypothetical protein
MGLTAIPPAGARQKARWFAGILSSESAGVMAVMRQNSKWALVPGYGYGDDDVPDDPLLEEFKAVRRKLFTWHDWDQAGGALVQLCTAVYSCVQLCTAVYSCRIQLTHMLEKLVKCDM